MMRRMDLEAAPRVPVGIVGWLLFALVAAGCGSGRTVGISSTNPATGALSLDRDLQPLLTARCALVGCHAGASPQLGMDLSAGKAWSSIVSVASVSVPGEMRIKPGDPDHSFLFEKISQDRPSAGNRMPLSGQPLSPDEIDTIRKWILQGAKP